MQRDLDVEVMEHAGVRLRDRARVVAERVIETEGEALGNAFDSGNVLLIEAALMRVFELIYLEGYADASR